MPRQRGSVGGGSRRPTAAPSRAPAAPSQQQTRPAATYAAPPGQAPHHQAPSAAPPTPASSSGPGLFGQMASTAAGVAVGHTVANGVMGLFGGGSSSNEAAEASPQSNAAQQNNYQSQQQDPNCAMATKSFTECMDTHQGNMSICGWYMEQLKACQAAAKPY